MTCLIQGDVWEGLVVSDNEQTWDERLACINVGDLQKAALRQQTRRFFHDELASVLLPLPRTVLRLVADYV